MRLGVDEVDRLKKALPLFQFQLGAIGSNTADAPLLLDFDVSIPAWCDWENCIMFKSSYSIIGFNSSLVRLGVFEFL